MNTVINRVAQRATRNSVQKRFSSNQSLEELNRDMVRMKWITLFCIPPMLAFFYRIMTAPHEHVNNTPYAHKTIMEKSFPWGDGTKPMFHHMFGNPHEGHDEEEHH